jgi:hypothetical protein
VARYKAQGAVDTVQVMGVTRLRTRSVHEASFTDEINLIARRLVVAIEQVAKERSP